MTLEIRELVIEARVVDDSQPNTVRERDRGLTEDEMARLVERVTRRVLEALHEQRERL
ncbi:DUF5908 family protein [Pseudomonas aeruginosa]|uniref:DUF5908 family protein n=1 Tax=Pseudomonas aeruginosa TaxID=287 RepID=UPI002ADD9AB8|nr:DUF5908 family protein [Pseudomonas aeruginosa]MEA0988988.1 DUF5908 family protein [Pseudomonas aeruginosa]HCF3047449.1 hypothetical protein [Pseudomonas aeruginosa]HCL3290488.1 hypothetical protein [Pseudomonas aeruginosa]